MGWASGTELGGGHASEGACERGDLELEAVLLVRGSPSGIGQPDDRRVSLRAARGHGGGAPIATMMTMRGLCLLGVLVLPTHGCSSELPPAGQVVLHVDTDAIVGEPAGTPADPTRLAPLVDRARFEVLVDGQQEPVGGRDVVIDARMFRDRQVSFGIVPPPSVTAAIASLQDSTVKYTSQCVGSPSCTGRMPPLSAPSSRMIP